MRPQCKCGRFLANATATASSGGEGYSWHMYVADVRGDCSQCGPDIQAIHGGCWAWNLWAWPGDAEAAA